MVVRVSCAYIYVTQVRLEEGIIMLQSVEIVEQPMSRGQRFRYKCEGKSAGSLLGVRSTQMQKTFPSIKVHNHSGPAAIVVSCVTKDAPYYPHPHNLVGQDCHNGVCTLRVKSCSGVISMSNVGVQCCKRQDIALHLKEREEIRVDPFGNLKDVKKEEIDLGVVRLCFQVFLPDVNKKFTVCLAPAVSDPVIDKKCIQDLVICRASINSGTCLGGNEMFLLCEKVNKDDIQVRFYEETSDGTAWEGYGNFSPADVHRQSAIVLKTPAYKDCDLSIPARVMVQLRKPSDNSFGEPIDFTYLPNSRECLVDSTQNYDNINFCVLLNNNTDSQDVTTTSLNISELQSIIGNGPLNYDIHSDLLIYENEIQTSNPGNIIMADQAQLFCGSKQARQCTKLTALRKRSGVDNEMNCKKQKY